MEDAFGQILRRHIARKNLTSARFAKLVNKSQSFVSSVLSGHKKPPEDFVKAAVAALGLGAEDAGRLALSGRLEAADETVRAYVRDLERRLAGPNLGLPDTSALAPRPPDERKFAIPKKDASPLLALLAGAQWSDGVSPVLWRDWAAAGRTVSFAEPDDKNGFAIVQVSYVVRFRDGVEIVERRAPDPRKRPRITEGASLLLSFSPDPSRKLREQLDEHVRKTVFPDEARKRAFHYRVEPLGTLLNAVNVKARSADETAPPRERPAFVMLCAQLLVDRPVRIWKQQDDREDDRHQRTRLVDELRFADFEGFADRAVVHRLRHPDNLLPYVANGSAILVRADRMPGWLDPAWESDRES